MHKHIVSLSMVAVLSVALIAGVWAQPEAPPKQGTATGQESQSPPTSTHSQSGDAADTATMPPGVLVSTESLLGIGVKNSQGESVGDLKQLMIDHRTGRVLYAVVAMGGFLGMGEKTIIVPWHTMQVVQDRGSLQVTLPHDVLEPAPNTAPSGQAGSGG